MKAELASSIIDTDLWRRLYELAARVRKLGPWTWMEETDVFGVERPETADMIFVSVMGALGEHYAVAVYPDAAALTSLWAIHHDEHAIPEQVLEVPQIQLSFEDREFIEPEDLKIIKQLGLKYRGKNAWPRFRSYRPGFAPWFIDGDEAMMMVVALEQLLDVAPRFRADPMLLRLDDPQEYRVRVIRDSAVGKAWTDELQTIAPVDISLPRFLPGADEVRQCHLLPKMDRSIEVDFFLVPAAIGDGTERPLYPYSLLMVDSADGLIIGQEMLAASKSFNDMLGSIPSKLIDVFKQLGIRPSRLIVHPGRFADIVRPSCEALGVELRIQRKLPHLEPARRSLFEFLAQGG